MTLRTVACSLPQRALLYLVVLLGCAAATGCREPASHRMEFPGFSLTTPWPFRQDPAWRYATGQVHQPMGINVSWSIGRQLTVADFRRNVALIAAPVPAQAVVPAHGQNAKGLKAATTLQGKPAVFALFPCGARLVQVILSWSSLTPAAANAILGSFRCAPDATLELALTSVAPFAAPAAVMAAWTPVPGDVEFVMTRGAAVLRAREVEASRTDADVPWFLTGRVKATGSQWALDRVETVPTPGGPRTVAFGTVVTATETGVAAFTTLECETRRVFVSISAPDPSTLQQALPILTAATCVR